MIRTYVFKAVAFRKLDKSLSRRDIPIIAHGFNRGVEVQRNPSPAGSKEASRPPGHLFLKLRKALFLGRSLCERTERDAHVASAWHGQADFTEKPHPRKLR